MAHLFIDNVCVNCGCDSGKVGAGQPCPNPSEDDTIKLSDVTPKCSNSICRRLKIIGVMGDTNVSVATDVAAPPFIANDLCRARKYLQQLLDANGLPSTYKLMDGHTDAQLLSFEGMFKVCGTTDFIVVPSIADGDLALHICVLFRIRSPVDLSNATKDHIFTTMPVELIAARGLSEQPTILQIVTNLNDVSSGFRLEQRVTDGVRITEKKRYDFSSPGQMAAFVVDHLKRCNPFGYLLSDMRPGDAFALSLKRKILPEAPGELAAAAHDTGENQETDTHDYDLSSHLEQPINSTLGATHGAKRSREDPLRPAFRDKEDRSAHLVWEEIKGLGLDGKKWPKGKVVALARALNKCRSIQFDGEGDCGNLRDLLGSFDDYVMDKPELMALVV